VKHPLYVHNIPLSTIRRWNLTFHIILSFSLIVASLLHGHVEHLSTSRWPSCRWSCTIFVNDIYGQFFMHIFSKDLEVCLKLQELASPAWRLAGAWPKAHDESFHVQRYYSEWWAHSWRKILWINITMQQYETWGGRSRSLAIFILLFICFSLMAVGVSSTSLVTFPGSALQDHHWWFISTWHSYSFSYLCLHFHTIVMHSLLATSSLVHRIQLYACTELFEPNKNQRSISWLESRRINVLISSFQVRHDI